MDLFLQEQWANMVGLIGVALVLITYLLLQLDKLASESFAYSFWNLIGALLVLTSLLVHFNLSSLVIEVAWILISLYGIYKSLKNNKNKE